MEFRDLKRQYQLHREAIDAGIQEVVNGTHFIGGSQVGQLEERLAAFVGVKYCVACGNGTDALQLALMAWEIGAGDAVFVPDFTFFSSGEVVPLAGAVPVFVDVDPHTFNIDCDSLEKAIAFVTQHTDYKPRAVVAVDLFGQPAQYDQIRAIADRYDMLVLEDAAQSFGGRLHGKRTCSLGDISTTSFFPSKPLGCYGDGGAVFTDNDEWADRLRSLHVHGKGGDKYDNIRIGMNSRLDTLQAAVLLAKLDFLEEELAACQRVADRYTGLLKDVVQTPRILENRYSAWAQYTICLKDAGERDRVISAMKEAGIPSAVYYKKPMHLQEAFRGRQIEAVPCEAAEDLSGRCLSLPLHPYLEKAETEMICECIRGAVTG